MNANIFDELADRTRKKSDNSLSDEWRYHFDNQPTELIEWIQTQPIDGLAVNFEIYESLAKSDLPPSTFLITEFERLLNLLETDLKNEHLYLTIESFAFLSENEKTHEPCQRLISGYLGSKLSQIRRFSIWLIADFMSASDIEILRSIQNLAQFDHNWRVRVCAQSVLSDLYHADKGFPEPQKMRLLDKLRYQFLGPEICWKFHM